MAVGSSVISITDVPVLTPSKQSSMMVLPSAKVSPERGVRSDHTNDNTPLSVLIVLSPPLNPSKPKLWAPVKDMILGFHAILPLTEAIFSKFWTVRGTHTLAPSSTVRSGKVNMTGSKSGPPPPSSLTLKVALPVLNPTGMGAPPLGSA